ncbi:hypothetical protein [Zhenhengia sp.]|uniref:hypothetical protein n=1 Tax=Zhenhengia sp. TaxID=2944208 RepID=UPI00307A6FCD
MTSNTSKYCTDCRFCKKVGILKEPNADGLHSYTLEDDTDNSVHTGYLCNYDYKHAFSLEHATTCLRYSPKN